jgi:hypothetical protein
MILFKIVGLKIFGYIVKTQLKKAFIIIEITNPIIPRIPIPIAETFAIVIYSFFVGFLKTNHTLLHFRKNDFADVISLLTIK